VWYVQGPPGESGLTGWPGATGVPGNTGDKGEPVITAFYFTFATAIRVYILSRFFSRNIVYIVLAI